VAAATLDEVRYAERLTVAAARDAAVAEARAEEREAIRERAAAEERATAAAARGSAEAVTA